MRTEIGPFRSPAAGGDQRRAYSETAWTGPDTQSSGHSRATLTIWAEKQGIALTYIQPGKPQQNAYVERYNRTVRHEWLDLYIFETIEEVQQIATEWLWTYNNERPNMGIGGVTPAMKLKMAA